MPFQPHSACEESWGLVHHTGEQPTLSWDPHPFPYFLCTDVHAQTTLRPLLPVSCTISQALLVINPFIYLSRASPGLAPLCILPLPPIRLCLFHLYKTNRTTIEGVANTYECHVPPTDSEPKLQGTPMSHTTMRKNAGLVGYNPHRTCTWDLWDIKCKEAY